MFVGKTGTPPKAINSLLIIKKDYRLGVHEAIRKTCHQSIVHLISPYMYIPDRQRTCSHSHAAAAFDKHSWPLAALFTGCDPIKPNQMSELVIASSLNQIDKKEIRLTFLRVLAGLQYCS